MRLLQAFLGSLLVLLFFGNAIEAVQHTLIAPQIIREGVEETLVLNLHGVAGVVDVTATLRLGGVENFVFKNVDATKPIQMKVKLRPREGEKEIFKREYVEVLVIAQQGGKKVYESSLKMRLIDSSGYIHVQTDRPIYKPEENVRVRVAALTHHQQSELLREVEIVIRIPLDNVAVDKRTLRMPFNQFIETNFKLPEFPVFGIWSIQSRFLDEKIAKWSEIKFAVRPYVLPTFNVDLTLDKPYILVKDIMLDEYIEGTITSKYSYGKTVGGSYFLLAKLKRPGSVPVIFYQFPGNLQKKAVIAGGKQRIKIKTLEVLNVLLGDDDFSTLEEEGATVTIVASVTSRDEGVVESDVSRAIPFVKSPYQIDVSRMSKYYTPGTAFEMKIDVLDSVSKKPVSDVEVVVVDKTGKEVISQNTDKIGQINKKINMDGVVEVKTFKIATRAFDIPETNAARIDISLDPYSSASKSILQLSAVNKIAEVGDGSFGIDAWFKQTPSQLRYVIFARGVITGSGIHVPLAGSTQTNFDIEIIGEMVPSFRIFVYYFKGAEIVSNSLWVDVKDACKKELKVLVPEEVRPGEHVNVEYEGSPNAILGLSAVDRAAYFLYDESRLTRESSFEQLNQYDTGCVREGGKNAQHVFEEGGLQLVGGPYPAKDDFTNHCGNSGNQGKKRKRREIPDVVQAKFDEAGQILGCKFDGLMENLANNDCVTRSTQVRNNQNDKIEVPPSVAYECAKIFYEACVNLTRLSKIGRSSGRAVNGNAQGFKAFGATARSNFEESMVWETVMLDGNGRLSQQFNAKDSITTFEFDTISMHQTDGFCVAETQNMKIFKDIFIKMKLPYSLKRMEQVEIRATVFNYGPIDQNITVSVKMGKDICSHFPQGTFTEVRKLVVDMNSAKTASFTLLPLRVPADEHVYIEMQAHNGKGDLLDWVKESILVEPEGMVKDIKGTHAIDLKNKKAGTKEEFSIDFRFPEKYLPGSRQCWIYPYSNFMGPIIEFDPVTKQPKNDIKNIIRMPGGCGEQTMLSMGPNVYAHKYLRSVGRMTDGSPEEAGSIAKMQAGFTNQLKYRNTAENVWSVFVHYAPSVWLNAYVNKVFVQAKVFYVDMDMTPICNSVRWLLTKQDADGGFVSGGRVLHKEMHGAVATKLSLSAYVLISLIESSGTCAGIEKSVGETVTKAVNYLRANENSKELDQSYTLSLVSYAMSVTNPSDSYTGRLMQKLKSKVTYSPDNRLASWKGATLAQIQGTNTHAYWYQRKPLAIDVESTGYALLSIIYGITEEVTQEQLDLTRKIVLWLIEQRDENGGFSTTQDTVVGLQALSAYMVWINGVEPESKEVNIDLTIRGINNSEWDAEPKRIHLDKTNENFTTPIPVPPSVINKGKLVIEAEGEGDGSVSYRCIYRTLVEEDECHFQISATTQVKQEIIRAAPGQEKPVILKLSLFIKKSKGDPSGQSIVEVNLISGYKPIEQTLEQLSKTHVVDGTIERYEIANQKVILYLSEITSKPIRMAFLINREAAVAVPEPSSVTVYDYYEPTVKCTQFYGLPNDIPKLRTTVETCKRGNDDEEMCQCAEGGCLKCRSRDEQLKKTACLPEINEKCEICDKEPSKCYNMSQIACKSNYVYEIMVTRGINDDSGIFVEFEAEILTVYKRGNDVQADRNQKRKFMLRTDCFHNCKDPGLDKDGKEGPPIIFENRHLLVMSAEGSEDSTDKNGLPLQQYRLGDNTYIERIIPEEKCKSAREKLEKKCSGEKANTSDCKKQRAMNQSCYNLRLLRRMLIKGCDSGV